LPESSHAARQNRVRLLQALDQAVRQFRTREEIWPLRVPSAPLSLDDLVTRTLGGARLDARSLRARTLLRLEWPSGDTWELWIVALPSGLKLYCDTGGGETRLLATGRRDSEIETDRLFLELLAESAGQHFGIEMAGGPPSTVRSGLQDRAVVVDFFVTLFEELGLEAEIRARVGQHTDDFRTDVDAWLTTAGLRQP
jgi:hypothetical protein